MTTSRAKKAQDAAKKAVDENFKRSKEQKLALFSFGVFVIVLGGIIFLLTVQYFF